MIGGNPYKHSTPRYTVRWSAAWPTSMSLMPTFALRLEPDGGIMGRGLRLRVG